MTELCLLVPSDIISMPKGYSIFVYVIRTGHKRLAVIVKLHSDF